MKRRLYFLLPDAARTRSVVDELLSSGMEPGRIHAHAKPGIDLAVLPRVTTRQRSDALQT